MAEHRTPVPVEPWVREILRCPACRGTLDDSDRGDELVCQACAVAYPVRSGIPVLLADEARPVTR